MNAAVMEKLTNELYPISPLGKPQMREAMEKGLEKGLKKGRETGRDEGLEQGQLTEASDTLPHAEDALLDAVSPHEAAAVLAAALTE